MRFAATATVRSVALAIAVGQWALVACAKKSEASDGSGNLRVEAGEHGFVPSSLALAKGSPGSKTTVTFVRTTDKTCATEIVFPELGVKKGLALNQPVTIDVPTNDARTLTFQCGMGMYKGALVVR